jgi:hypothetical protein
MLTERSSTGAVRLPPRQTCRSRVPCDMRNAPERQHQTSAPERRGVAPWSRAPIGASGSLARRRHGRVRTVSEPSRATVIPSRWDLVTARRNRTYTYAGSCARSTRRSPSRPTPRRTRAATRRSAPASCPSSRTATRSSWSYRRQSSLPSWSSRRSWRGSSPSSRCCSRAAGRKAYAALSWASCAGHTGQRHFLLLTDTYPPFSLE